jgi:hypothetical protein
MRAACGLQDAEERLRANDGHNISRLGVVIGPHMMWLRVRVLTFSTLF